MQEPFELETQSTAFCQQMAEHYSENGLGLQAAAEHLEFSTQVVDHLAVLVIDEFTKERIDELVSHLRLWNSLAAEVLYHAYMTPEGCELTKTANSLASAMSELTERVDFLEAKAMGAQGFDAFFRMGEHWIFTRGLSRDMIVDLAAKEVVS